MVESVPISPFHTRIPAVILPAMRHPIPCMRLAAVVFLATRDPSVHAQFPEEKPRGSADVVAVNSRELRADLGESGDQSRPRVTMTSRESALAPWRRERAGTLRVQAGDGPGRAVAPFPGPPASLPSGAPTTQSVDPTTQEAASAMMKRHSGSLVFVSGTVGAGSGFIGQIGLRF